MRGFTVEYKAMSGILFRKIGIKSDILFQKIYIRSGIHLQKLDIRKGYVFEAWMACLCPKSGQVCPPWDGENVYSIAYPKHVHHHPRPSTPSATTGSITARMNLTPKKYGTLLAGILLFSRKILQKSV